MKQLYGIISEHLPVLLTIALAGLVGGLAQLAKTLSSETQWSWSGFVAAILGGATSSIIVASLLLDAGFSPLFVFGSAGACGYLGGEMMRVLSQIAKRKIHNLFGTEEGDR